MGVLSELEPKRVFYYFEEINKVPRASYDCSRISQFFVDFAKKHHLEYRQDDYGNVIIKKPASPGYEQSAPVILQGHMDMVCQKTATSKHDFSKDPIEMYVDGNFIYAKDTTLGADDGIADAYALALLEDPEAVHPRLEVIFTCDEEVGMDGAAALDMSDIEGKMLINIDSEDEGIMTVGCAGGVRDVISIPVVREEKTGTQIDIHIRGLLGGHSGIEIHKQRGNSNKLFGRLLASLTDLGELHIVDALGGTKDNVIALSTNASILVEPDKATVVEAAIKVMEDTWRYEFGKDEPGVEIAIHTTKNVTKNVLDAASTKKAVFFLTCVNNGVYEFDRNLKELVDTSMNLGIFEVKEDCFESTIMIRSSKESKKQELVKMLDLWAETLGGSCDKSGNYPGWAFKSDSKLQRIMIHTYKRCFGRDIVIDTVHAGLECGLLMGKEPELDCVSFGPTMIDVHSVNEHLDIASTKRMWDYLVEVLKMCK